MSSPGAGVRFRKRHRDNSPDPVLWAAHALPSVIALTGLPADLAIESPTFAAPSRFQRRGRWPRTPYRTSRHPVSRPHRRRGHRTFRSPVAARPVLRNRATAAIRLWRGLAGHNPGPNPAALPKARRDRLILALRALDGRLDDATYREIASVLFGDAGGPTADGKAMIYAIDDPPRALRSWHDAYRLSPAASLSLSPSILNPKPPGVPIIP